MLFFPLLYYIIFIVLIFVVNKNGDWRKRKHPEREMERFVKENIKHREQKEDTATRMAKVLGYADPPALGNEKTNFHIGIDKREF